MERIPERFERNMFYHRGTELISDEIREGNISTFSFFISTDYTDCTDLFVYPPLSKICVIGVICGSNFWLRPKAALGFF